MVLPQAKVGLVIAYAYLWRHESEAGIIEGRKDRPCAVILVIHQDDGEEMVTVAPITHTKPRQPECAMEIPPRVKRHLNLDGERSWIMLDDFNEFIWPGYDLRPLPHDPKRYDFGFLPPSFYREIVKRILELRRKGLVFSPLRRD